jgi:hypothetical protein
MSLDGGPATPGLLFRDEYGTLDPSPEPFTQHHTLAVGVPPSPSNEVVSIHGVQRECSQLFGTGVHGVAPQRLSISHFASRSRLSHLERTDRPPSGASRDYHVGGRPRKPLGRPVTRGPVCRFATDERSNLPEPQWVHGWITVIPSTKPVVLLQDRFLASLFRDCARESAHELRSFSRVSRRSCPVSHPTLAAFLRSLAHQERRRIDPRSEIIESSEGSRAPASRESATWRGGTNQSLTIAPGRPSITSGWVYGLNLSHAGHTLTNLVSMINHLSKLRGHDQTMKERNALFWVVGAGHCVPSGIWAVPLAEGNLHRQTRGQSSSSIWATHLRSAGSPSADASAIDR